MMPTRERHESGRHLRTVVTFAIVACLGAVETLAAREVEPGRGAGDGMQNAALWPNHEGLPLRFTPVQVFGSDTEESRLLGRISTSSVAVDGAGNIFIRDVDFGRISSFTPDGQLSWSRGRKGEGPGEIQGGGGLALAGGNLIALERNSTRIDIWTKEGQYIRSHSLSEFGLPSGRLAGVYPDGLVVLHRSMATALGTEVFVFDSGAAWKLAGKFEAIVSRGTNVQMNRGTAIDVAVEGESIWVGNKGTYLLTAYDRNGSVQRTLSTGADYLRRPGYYSGEGRMSFINLGGLMAPVTLSSGHLLVYAAWPMNVEDSDDFARRRAEHRAATDIEWACSLDLFSADGNLVGSSVWEGTRAPEVGRPITVDAAGALYTVAHEPFPQVRKYLIAFD